MWQCMCEPIHRWECSMVYKLVFEYLCVLICMSEFVSVNTHISMFVCSEYVGGFGGMILWTYDYICVKACIYVSVNISVFMCLNWWASRWVWLHSCASDYMRMFLLVSMIICMCKWMCVYVQKSSECVWCVSACVITLIWRRYEYICVSECVSVYIYMSRDM